MKKLLCLCLALILSASFMVGCGKNQDPANTNTPTQENANEAASQQNEEGNPASSNEDPDPNADGEFYISLGDSSESIYYHTKDCSVLSGKEKQQITWEMVKSLGFRQCETCKPPKYEGYIE